MILHVDMDALYASVEQRDDLSRVTDTKSDSTAPAASAKP